MLPCGHFPSGINDDGSPRCGICAEKAWLENLAAEREAAEKARAARPVMPDPTHAGVTTEAPAAARAIGETEPVAGVYSLPDSIYHADPLRAYGTESLTNSHAKLLLRPFTPAHFRVAVDESVAHAGRANLTEGMIFGSAFHAVTLGTAEPTPFDGASWASKAAKEFLAECEAFDRVPVLARDVAPIRAMADRVRSHPVASVALSNGRPEQAMVAYDSKAGVWLRSKVDWLGTPVNDTLILADLKSTTDLPAPEVFARTAGKYGYVRQAAFYPRVARTLGIARRVSMVFIVAESRPPYSVAVLEPERDDLRRAEALNEAAVRTFADCLSRDDWPSYPPVVHRFALPGWVARDEDNILEGLEE